jgi:hypothetical protein
MADSKSEFDVRGVLWGGATIVIGTVLAALVSYVLWQWWNAPSGLQPVEGPGTPAMVAPQPERARYFAEKQRLLESWEWVDRRAGIARIPVEEAMRIMAQRGARTSSSKEQR